MATGKFNWDLKRLPQFLKSAGGKPPEILWKEVGIDWRRGYVISQDLEAFQKGLEGYKLFAEKYANGHMTKAYTLASALLTKAEFKALKWGKQIRLKVGEVDRMIEVLRRGLKDGTLKGIEGYKKFATDHVDGNMQKAYQLASALLTKAEFKALEWGIVIRLKASEVDQITQVLRAGLKNGSLKGIQGYKKFSIDYANDHMDKAYQLASALLTKTEFKALEWGKAIHLKVSEVDRERKKLLKGLADGTYKNSDGWLQYAITISRPPQSIWKNASALLDKQFAELEWPTKREAVKLVRKKAA